MGFYDIDFDVVIHQHKPVRLRKPIRFAWLRLLAWPVVYLYNLFMSFRADRNYQLEHNSQVCYMEAALNDTFDMTDRLIYIADGPYEEPTYIYLAEELKEVWIALDSELPVTEYDAPLYLYTDEEVSETGVQFIVYYPDGLVFDMERMKALVNRYRLPGKWNYTIVSYVP